MAKGSRTRLLPLHPAALAERGRRRSRHFGITLAAFHRRTRERAARTGRTRCSARRRTTRKRSEDVRARLNVLSEIPFDWETRIAKWRPSTARARRSAGGPCPSRSEEYLLYQTLVGSWPVGDRAVAFHEYRTRISRYMIKALREAKVNTSWANAERAVRRAREHIRARGSDRRPRNPFLDDLDEFVGSIALPGSECLGQTLLKLTSPGVPDIYQGNEVWDFSLVDPDNRRPVDYRSRAALLAALEEAAEDEARVPELLRELLESLGDGRAKLYTIWRALAFRNEQPELFARGSHEPIAVHGTRAEHVVSFARRHEGARAVVAVGRWFASLPRHVRDGAAGFEWGDTVLALPPGEYRNLLSSRTVVVRDAGLRADELFADFPVALLRAG